MFCAQSRPTNKKNRDQNHITKRLVSFISSLTLLLMVQYKTGVLNNLDFRQSKQLCFEGKKHQDLFEHLKMAQVGGSP